MASPLLIYSLPFMSLQGIASINLVINAAWLAFCSLDHIVTAQAKHLKDCCMLGQPY